MYLVWVMRILFEMQAIFDWTSCCAYCAAS